MRKIVVLTGAGISAESGLKTFRDAGGLWEGHDVMEVASIEGWQANPEKVLDFYNKRRTEAAKAEPNTAHQTLAELESSYKVTIITQNVDNLHERAGSSHVIHLHGQLSKARSVSNPDRIYEIGTREIHLGDFDESGNQLRPHVVWFGEMVPMMESAIIETRSADIFIVIGTSLAVYPAAGLLDFVNDQVPVFLIDPNSPERSMGPRFHYISEKATVGTPDLVYKLIEQKNIK